MNRSNLCSQSESWPLEERRFLRQIVKFYTICIDYSITALRLLKSVNSSIYHIFYTFIIFILIFIPSLLAIEFHEIEKHQQFSFFCNA